MTPKLSWKILHVDDQETQTNYVKEYLEGETIEDGVKCKISPLNHFEQLDECISNQNFDLIILDVRLGPTEPSLDDIETEAGIKALLKIQKEKFLPIIFYTAVPKKVDEYLSNYVKVVDKNSLQHLENLLTTVNGLYISPLLKVHKTLIRHLEKDQGDFLWDLVNKEETLFEDFDTVDIAHFLGRRLANSLSEEGIQKVISEINGKKVPKSENIHPCRFYIIPYLEKFPLAGDIYKDENNSYFVLLTPSCDMVIRNGKTKAPEVLLAQCLLLEEEKEYKDWAKSGSNNKKDALIELLKNNRKAGPERYHFLPGAYNLPDQIIDFQNLRFLKYSELENLERIASLDSPFSEDLLIRFNRYCGRIGTPDIDTECICDRLKTKFEQSSGTPDSSE